MNDNPDPSMPDPDEAELRALSAFVDGELPQAERAAVLDRVARDPQAASRVAAYHAQTAALKSLFAGDSTGQCIVLRQRVPWWRRAGLAACWVVLGIALGLVPAWFAPAWIGARGSDGSPGFAHRADIAYAVYAPEQRHPVEVVAAQQDHLVSWLSNRLKRDVTIPSLAEYGYTLVGGRLLPGETAPAAQFMYQNAAGERLTLYMTAIGQDDLPVKVLRDADRRTFYWANDYVGYAMSGPISEAALRKIAYHVCGSLGGRPDQW
jgi:anti-sigma factor RsiW